MASAYSSQPSFEIEEPIPPPPPPQPQPPTPPQLQPAAAIPPPPPRPHHHATGMPAPPPPSFEAANPPPPPPPPPQHHEQANAGGGRPARRGWIRLLEENDRFLEDVAPSLMLVAALVSGFAFQAGLNPPGGVVTEASNRGKSILALTNHSAYETYFTLQIIALVASISVVASMVSGLPLNRRITVLLLRLVTWVSLMAMVLINAVSVTSFTPINIHGPDSVILKLRNSLFALAVIMGVILCAHIVRLIVRRGGRGQRVE